jgi:hypothetical protein
MVKILVLGQKLFEGKGKAGPSFLKSVNAEGVKQMYAWTAMVKGMGWNGRRSTTLLMECAG